MQSKLMDGNLKQMSRLSTVMSAETFHAIQYSTVCKMCNCDNNVIFCSDIYTIDDHKHMAYASPFPFTQDVVKDYVELSHDQLPKLMEFFHELLVGSGPTVIFSHCEVGERGIMALHNILFM